MPDSGNAASEKAKEMIDEAPEQIEKIRLMEKDREWREKMVGETIEGNQLVMKTATPEDYGIDIHNITSEAQLEIAKALLEQPPTEANKLAIWENSRARINAEEADRQRVIDQRDAQAFADAEIERAHRQSQTSDGDKQEMQKNEKKSGEEQSNESRVQKTVQEAEFETQKRQGASDDNAAKAAAEAASRDEKQRIKDAEGLEAQRSERARQTEESRNRDERHQAKTEENVSRETGESKNKGDETNKKK